MKKVALIGAVSTAVIVMVIVLASSVTRDGVSVGIKVAEACNKTGTAECLPQLSYVDTDGTVWTEEMLAGKVVLVNFWATWCRPCQAEIPALTAMYQRYADKGIVLLGILHDAGDVDDSTLEAFAKRWDLNFPVVRMDRDIWEAFDGPDKLPTTFVYDRTGKLSVQHRGVLTEGQLQEIIEDLEKQPSPPLGGLQERKPLPKREG